MGVPVGDLHCWVAVLILIVDRRTVKIRVGRDS